MTGAGVEVADTIMVPTMTPGVLAQALLRTVESAGQHQVLRLDSFRYQLTRRARPSWATVLGWVAAPLLVGIPVLLVRTTERCEATVLVEPVTALRLSGRLPAALLATLRTLAEQFPPETLSGAPVIAAPNALQPEPHAFQAPHAFQPAQLPRLDSRPPLTASFAAVPSPHSGTPVPALAPGQLIDGVPGRSPVAPASPPAAAPVAAVDAMTRRRAPQETPACPVDASSRPVALVLEPGGRRLVLGRRSLLGRDPAVGDEGADELVRLTDAQISKTHLAFGIDEGGVWVADQHSTNGSAILRPDGAVHRCPAGERVHLAPGDVVALGPYRLSMGEQA